jgi:hypothetical protein
MESPKIEHNSIEHTVLVKYSIGVNDTLITPSHPDARRYSVMFDGKPVTNVFALIRRNNGK